MIQANELRIGNWVNITDNVNCFVTFIGEYRCHLKADKAILPKLLINGSVANEDISPIPLTPEILQKCGFEMEKDGFAHSQGERDIWRNRIGITQEDDKFNLAYEVDDYWYNYRGIQISSLHQLQNLYFALTGEELTINL